ncbi:MAG: class A beta-lactamase-related serine hydrolase [Proteobacteria bacterium]|nr:MAG: class A beta-lactamase-related serine hydrolase [Pseudomonadota bacterium]
MNLHLPTFQMSKKLPKEITVRHLLNHTSGIPDYFTLEDWEQLDNSEISRADLVSKFLSLPRLHKAGEKFAYSNSNYYLLGLIIEQVSGVPYDKFVAERLATKAGLRNTAYCSEKSDSQQFAKGYIVNKNQNELAKSFNLKHPFSAGGLCSTATDLALWTFALSQGKVVSPHSYTQMVTPPPGQILSNPSYGFGLQIGTGWNHRYIIHGGGIYGFINQSDYFPDDELIVIVLSNTETSLASLLAISLEKSLLGLTKDLKIDSVAVNQLVGTYKFADAPVTFEVTQANGTLFGHARFPEKSEPPMKMLFQGDKKFWINERAAELDFKSSADSRITGLEMRGGGGPPIYAVKQKQ